MHQGVGALLHFACAQTYAMHHDRELIHYIETQKREHDLQIARKKTSSLATMGLAKDKHQSPTHLNITLDTIIKCIIKS